MSNITTQSPAANGSLATADTSAAARFAAAAPRVTEIDQSNEEDDDAQISFTDDDVGGDAQVTKPEPKPAAKEDSAPELTKEEESAVFSEPEGEKDAAEAAPVVTADKSGRDYTKYAEPVAKLLRKMPNSLYNELGEQVQQWYEAANKTKPELEARIAELQKNAPPTYYYEHPEAYKLLPEYASVSRQLTGLDFETNHWRAQLANIKNGEDWYELQGYDESDKPVFKLHKALQNGKVDIESEIAVAQTLQQTQGARSVAAQQIGTLQNNWKTQVTSAAQQLNDLDLKLFPKMQEKDLTAEDKKNISLALSAAPAPFQRHPMTLMAAKSFAAYMRLVAMYKAKDEELAKYKKTKTIAKLAGPKLKSTNGGTVSKDDEVITENYFGDE